MGAAAARSAMASAVGRAANDAVSFLVFLLLDALEVLLCVAYKVADYVVEGAWRPCYCSSSSPASPASAATGKIVVSERGGSKVVSMLSATRLHLEDISDTLYTRPSVLASCAAAAAASSSSSPRRAPPGPGVTVHSAIVQMLRGKVGGDGSKHRPYPSPRWSDCHCANCNPADTDRLFVHVEAPQGGDGAAATEEDVLFIHGFKSLTLVAPPYFPVPRGEVGTQYVLRTVAPRRVWPPIAFGASVACWYEHLSRTVSIVLCKHHRLWELAFRVFTLYRVRTYLMDGFFCHTHIASWHTLHNIICGSAGKIDRCLEVVRDQLTCDVTVYHGSDDELLPVQCSYAVKSKIPRAQVRVIDGKDHVTIVVGRQKDLARELEEIWDRKR